MGHVFPVIATLRDKVAMSFTRELLVGLSRMAVIWKTRNHPRKYLGPDSIRYQPDQYLVSVIVRVH